LNLDFGLNLKSAKKILPLQGLGQNQFFYLCKAGLLWNSGLWPASSAFFVTKPEASLKASLAPQFDFQFSRLHLGYAGLTHPVQPGEVFGSYYGSSASFSALPAGVSALG